MNDEQLSKCLAELGNISRLKIFKLLVQAGYDGLNVGTIQKTLEIPGSTLSHHLTKLISVDLVIQNRNGRVLTCIVNYEKLDLVLKELKNQCCFGVKP